MFLPCRRVQQGQLRPAGEVLPRVRLPLPRGARQVLLRLRRQEAQHHLTPVIVQPVLLFNIIY